MAYQLPAVYHATRCKIRKARSVAIRLVDSLQSSTARQAPYLHDMPSRLRRRQLIGTTLGEAAAHASIESTG